MSINSTSNHYARLGNQRFPIRPEMQGHAQYYDANGDQLVTLGEIEATTKDWPQMMTVDSKDYAIGVRAELLGQKSPYADSYPTSKEVEQQLKELAASHRDKAQVVTIGHSTEGRPIKALRVSNDVRKKATKDKPTVVINGNIHAREWATNGAVTEAARKVLNGAADEALENLEVYFVANSNPDGYEYSRDVNPMWRKNTWRDSQGEIKGVDLNRNFGHQFRLAGDTRNSTSDDVGASDDPNQLTYRGVSPFSEPESQAIKELMDREQDAVGLLDVHGFGRMLLISNGQHDVSKKDYKKIAQAMNESIKYVDYAIDTDEGLYPTTGGLSTYADAQGLVGITMEMGTSFHPRPEEAARTIDRASDGIVEFVRQMEERAAQRD